MTEMWNDGNNEWEQVTNLSVSRIWLRSKHRLARSKQGQSQIEDGISSY